MPPKETNVTLEERLLNNAVDTVVKNIDAYDPPALVHLLSEIVKREDLGSGIFRIMSASLSREDMKDLGLGGMAGTGDDVMNFLTIPRLHRTLLRGLQQMQENLMPGGFLLRNEKVDMADATRMFRDCTTQLDKILRLTKAAKANAEVIRLKEALSVGLIAIGEKLGPKVRDEAYKVMSEAINESLGRTNIALEEMMQEAEEAGS